MTHNDQEDRGVTRLKNPKIYPSVFKPRFCHATGRTEARRMHKSSDDFDSLRTCAKQFENESKPTRALTIAPALHTWYIHCYSHRRLRYETPTKIASKVPKAQGNEQVKYRKVARSCPARCKETRTRPLDDESNLNDTETLDVNRHRVRVAISILTTLDVEQNLFFIAFW